MAEAGDELHVALVEKVDVAQRQRLGDDDLARDEDDGDERLEQHDERRCERDEQHRSWSAAAARC